MVVTTDALSPIAKVFFEYNCAYMAVFKDTAGTYVQHHFEVDSTGGVRVWETWLGKGALLYEGRWSGDDIALSARSAKQPQELRLTRKNER